jgi:cellulose synthase/poly-beta-1,6-N-acetylglucosamine synthase-like glycosyltransferase
VTNPYQMARSPFASVTRGAAALLAAVAGGGALGAVLARRKPRGEQDAAPFEPVAAESPEVRVAPIVPFERPPRLTLELLPPIEDDEEAQPVERPTPSAPEDVDPDRDIRVDVAIHRLQDLDPDLSASEVLLPRQRTGFLVAAGIVLVLLGLTPVWTLRVLATITTAVYAGSLLFRFQLLSRSRRITSDLRITDAEALALTDGQLPLYSILCPAFGEPALVERLLGSLARLDYPTAKLDILLLLEEDDAPTVEAARAALLEPGNAHIKLVLVPAAEPRTKPKALNYGLELAIGDLLTIFDAEDRPEPLQLRKAVIGLDRAGERTACLQAKLGYYNPDQNVITRWFTIEYDMWFSEFLPGLTDLDAPLPLGGTSNHFRTEVLRSLGGWDPFNVTEDADLGLRLHRLGYRTGVLDATTLEEANSDFVNWIRQRSRWYKGYLQTWLVHMRKPRQLRDEIGTGGFVRFNLFVGGTPVIALLNPVFWTLVALWFIGRPHLLEQAFPPIIYHLALLSWVGGNFVFLYTFLLVARDHPDRDHMVPVCLFIPAYWVMMSLAAAKALVSLVADPSYWEKTVHGLDEPAADAEIIDLADRRIA